MIELHVHLKDDSEEFETNDLVDDTLQELVEMLMEENPDLDITKLTVRIN